MTATLMIPPSLYYVSSSLNLNYCVNSNHGQKQIFCQLYLSKFTQLKIPNLLFTHYNIVYMYQYTVLSEMYLRGNPFLTCCLASTIYSTCTSII